MSNDESQMIWPESWCKELYSDAVVKISTSGKKLNQKQYLKSGKFPVIDQGQNEIGGYTDDSNLIIKKCDFPVIVFGDHTRAVKLVKQPFAAGADGVKVIEPKKFIIPTLLEYFTQYLALSIKDKGYARHFQWIEKEYIGIPPENEQHRIVAKIEELFSELDKGVESLKTAREQLKVYRQALLKHAFEGKLTEQWRAAQGCASVARGQESEATKENADDVHGSTSVAGAGSAGATKLESADELLARIQQEREVRYQQQLEDWKTAVKQWEAEGKEGKKTSKPSKYKALPSISEEELALLPSIPKSWTYHRLVEIASIGSGISVSKSRKLLNPIEVPYLRVANVQRGQLELNEIKTMLIEKNKLNELALKKWDVLFNEGGDRDKLGRGWIWEEQVSPCITQNHVFRATTYLGGEEHAKFISHWGNVFGRNYFEKGGKQTTNLASINKTVLSMFPVPLPPMEEQIEIITQLEASITLIDEFEKEIQSALSKSEALRQSILKKAFSGKLVQQDPNDEPASILLERIKAEKAEAAARLKLTKVAKKPKTKTTTVKESR